jgi:Regulator of G protein signaling domain
VHVISQHTADENIDFIVEVNDFEKEAASDSNADVKQVTEKAAEIHKTYVEEEAERAVNIPAHIREPIVKTFQEDDLDVDNISTVFASPKKEIANLIVRNGFVSSFYRQIKKNIPTPEITQRGALAVVSLIMAVGTAIMMMAMDMSRWLRLLTFIPFAMACQNFWSAYYGT